MGLSTLAAGVVGGAWIEGEYRYLLTRRWGDGEERVLWVMLNPSVADAGADDATIRRCIRFSRREGVDGMGVVNLFARRATRPVHLSDPGDPVGPRNGLIIRRAIRGASLVVASWGAHRAARAEAPGTIAAAREERTPLMCLGATKDGSPRHPLYVPADQPLVPYEAAG